MTRKDYQKFARSNFGVEFNDAELLKTAFTHRSYLNEHPKSADEHNERMEFLGDAVLELITTEFLYENYEEAEGILTNWRSALVRTESLAESAEEYEFEKYLRLSRGERRGSKRARQQIMANTMEAVIGALYIDQDYETTKKFIKKAILSKLDEILKTGSWQDPKTTLQERAQAEDNETPTYEVLKEEGPDHEKVFTIGVYIGDDLAGKGTGHSKQEAQQAAADNALARYKE